MFFEQVNYAKEPQNRNYIFNLTNTVKQCPVIYLQYIYYTSKGFFNYKPYKVCPVNILNINLVDDPMFDLVCLVLFWS